MTPFKEDVPRLPAARTSFRLVLAMLAMIAVPAALTLHSVRTAPQPGALAADSSPYGYTVSLLLFIVPILVIGLWLLPAEGVKISKDSFLLTVAILFPVGAGLDFFFARVFFTYSNAGATLRITAPALGGGVPIEEYAFYLAGFVAVLLIYIWLDEYWLAAYGVRADAQERAQFERLLRFHPASLLWAVVLIAAAIAYRRFFVQEPGFPGYFVFLVLGALGPSAALLPAAMPVINWRALSLAVFMILLISLLWEVTLAVPYGWWGFQDRAMIGLRITAWSRLPIEEVCVWIAVTYATVIVYEIVRRWKSSGKRIRHALFGTTSTLDSTSEERASTPLANADLKMARTVAIVVHGVGDHTSGDILTELLAGLESNLASQSSATRYIATRLQIHGFPLADGKPGVQQVMRIDSGRDEYFLLPVVWSHLRLRSNQEIREGERSGRMPGPIPHMEAIGYLLGALPALFMLPIHCLRCVFKAAGFWKVAVLLTACLVLGVEWGLVWTLLHMLNSGQARVESVNGAMYINMIPVLLLGFGALGCLKFSLPVLDFAGDVFEYVGSLKRRDNLESQMAEIIAFVLRHAPRADLLVVGHSLGSVLVTHSVLRKGEWTSGSRRLILLTLGSPLKLLSKVFPSCVLNPAQLAARYAQDRVVALWFNAWRSYDVVGKSLASIPAAHFNECCLGRGGHTNYWRDVRLWQRVFVLMNLV